MGKAAPKLVLASAQGIAFNRLVLSQANVRRISNGVTIEQLAADIERRGLLQSLSVRPVLDADGHETGAFEVPAGGRRFAALALLVRRKRLAPDAPVPCIVKPADDPASAAEDSYAENAHREALHPLDEFRGMKTLVDQGSAIEDVAARFHVTPALVRQRLRLASVSPVLHEVYASDAMTLEQLMAFTVSDDHARQEQVWDMVQTSQNHSVHYIRARLNETTVPAGDRRALFVGIEAYVAAGGHVVRDLFEEDRGGWLQDAALLDRLALEKLEAEAERLRGEGWKWVESVIDLPYGFAQGLLRRLEPMHTPPTQDELAEVATLHAEADALEDQWANADEIPDEVEARVTAIDERIAQLTGGCWTYAASDIAIGGVFLTIDRFGGLEVEAGWVRPEDEPSQVPVADPVDAALERPEGDAIAEGGVEQLDAASDSVQAATELDEDGEDGLRPLPDRLVSELTAARTLALQDAIARDPAIAFIAVLHNFVLACFYHGRTESCLAVSLNQVGFPMQPPGMQHSPSARAIKARHSAWLDRLPARDHEVWDALVALDSTERADLFAHCAAHAVNALYEAAPRYDHGRVSPHMIERRLAHSHVLARAVGLDLVGVGWRPTAENFFGRVTKARIIEAVSEGRGSETATLIDHLKKPDMAREAERLMEDAGWLPEPLRTPDLPVQAERRDPPELGELPAFLAEPGEEGAALAIAAE